MSQKDQSASINNAQAFFKKISAAVKKIGGQENDLLRVFKNDVLPAQIAELIVRGKTPDGFKAVIDYSVSLNKLIADGNFHLMDENITAANFPILGSGQTKIEFEIFQLKGRNNIEKILIEMKRRNLRPARIEELLYFGISYFGAIEYRTGLIAYGATWPDAENRIRVPFIDKRRKQLFLGLCYYDDPRFGYDRFLTVRQPSLAD